MKKFTFVAIFAVLAMNVAAVDLWSGSKHVSWADGGLQIAAIDLAGVQAGNLLRVHYTDATDGIEFKVMNANFDHLAGSREAAWIGGDGVFEQFLTAKAVDSLKLYGLEIIGANFTVTQVELLDGRAPREGITIWMGYFWADEWSTLELFRDAYADVDFSAIDAIRFYTEAAGEGYVINFLESFEEGGMFANQTAMTDSGGYKELPLTDELRGRIAQAGRWLVQFNKEQLVPFNVTEIVLVPSKDVPSALSDTQVKRLAQKMIRNGQIIIRQGDKAYNLLGIEEK